MLIEIIILSNQLYSRKISIPDIPTQMAAVSDVLHNINFFRQSLAQGFIWQLYGASPRPAAPQHTHSTICILPSNSTSHPIKNCPNSVCNSLLHRQRGGTDHPMLSVEEVHKSIISSKLKAEGSRSEICQLPENIQS